MSFKLYLDNKGVGAHDVVPNEEHIVPLAHLTWGPGWVGSLGRSPGKVPEPYTCCPSTRGNWGSGGLGIRSGKNS